MSEPQTEAGKALLDQFHVAADGNGWDYIPGVFEDTIAAIEAQARDAALAEAEAAVKRQEGVYEGEDLTLWIRAEDALRAIAALRRSGGAEEPTWQATDLGTMWIRKGILGPPKDDR